MFFLRVFLPASYELAGASLSVKKWKVEGLTKNLLSPADWKILTQKPKTIQIWGPCFPQLMSWTKNYIPLIWGLGLYHIPWKDNQFLLLYLSEKVRE